MARNRIISSGGRGKAGFSPGDHRVQVSASSPGSSVIGYLDEVLTAQVPVFVYVVPPNGEEGKYEIYLQYNTHDFYVDVNGAKELTIADGAITGSKLDASIDDLNDVAISNPVSGQFLKWNGSEWVNGDESGASSLGVNYFLQDTASGIGGYFTLLRYPAGGVEVLDPVTVKASDGEKDIEGYISDALGRTSLEAGEWTFDIYGKVNIPAGVSEIIAKVYTRTAGGAETLRFQVTTGNIDETSVTLHEVRTVQPAIAGLSATDRLLIKFYGKTSNPSDVIITLYHNGTSHYSSVKTPFTTLHNELPGLQGGTAGEYNHLTNAEKSLVSSHNFGGSQHAADTIANIQSKVSDGSLITSAAGEINGLTAKGTPTTSDMLIIEDAADANKKKKITIANLPAATPASHAIGGGTHSADTIANIQGKVSDGSLITSAAGEINGLTAKTTPTTSDLMIIEDVADANKKKKITIGSVPSKKLYTFVSYPYDWTTRVGYSQRLTTLDIGDCSWDASAAITGDNTICIARIPVPQYWDLGNIKQVNIYMAGLFSEAVNNDVRIGLKLWVLPRGQIIPADLSGYDLYWTEDIVTANKLYSTSQTNVSYNLVGGSADVDSMLIVKWNRYYLGETNPYAHTIYFTHLKVIFNLSF